MNSDKQIPTPEEIYRAEEKAVRSGLMKRNAAPASLPMKHRVG
jgi:hypothetical protein